jgi:hypothetical protein
MQRPLVAGDPGTGQGRDTVLGAQRRPGADGESLDGVDDGLAPWGVAPDAELA